ncbi:MAG: GNAT family N-acetyltransferase [Candidatus Eisenbacteria bacterium]|nr:GNAT family N-acetyltransferase [Candidatus Eisenbacteria bacterium]
MQTLRTVRLTLEPQMATHAGEMFAVLCDPAIYEFENEPPASLEWLQDRFTRLESRASGDGSERWLNWVVRVSGADLIGYVQASVPANGRAFIAYEVGSAHWGMGYGREAVNAMLLELAARYDVRQAGAVFKQQNHRSRKLLTRLDFMTPSSADREHYRPDADEDLLVLALGPG